MLEVGYEFGWRREDVRGLKVSRVNLVDGVIRKWSGETKNDEGRVAKMSPGLKVILQALIAGKKPDDFVFTRDDGKQVLDWRGAWWKACAGAGVGKILCSGCGKQSEGKLCRACGRRNMYAGLHFHDLRPLLSATWSGPVFRRKPRCKLPVIKRVRFSIATTLSRSKIWTTRPASWNASGKNSYISATVGGSWSAQECEKARQLIDSMVPGGGIEPPQSFRTCGF
jgi:hypothetical protein